MMASLRVRGGRHTNEHQSSLVMSGIRNGISTLTAARQATQICHWITDEARTSQPPNEVELFGALIASAIRAGRFGHLIRLSRAQKCLWYERWRLIRDHLVVKNLGLVHAAAKRFLCWTLSREEQQSAGELALLRAVDGCNPWLGFRFSTYAFHAIRRSLIVDSRKVTVYRSRFRRLNAEWVDECVRQIQIKGLMKLRQVLETDPHMQ